LRCAAGNADSTPVVSNVDPTSANKELAVIVEDEFTNHPVQGVGIELMVDDVQL
jgi:hypothetical protein